MKASDGSTEVTSLHAMYDGVAAITRWYHDKSNNSVVVGLQYGRDKVGNPNYELREHQSSYGDEYVYDNLYRLTRTVYDDTTPTSPTASPSVAVTDDFDYDDIGNRETAYLKSANATTYLANTLNEYTKSTLDGTDSLYDSDAAGNLTRIAAAAGSDTDGDWRFYYDYENALTKAEKYVTDGWVMQGEYVRDATGRRVEKVADGTTIRYYYDGMRAIEETEGTGSPTVERQYVFGNGIDEALVMYDENGGSYDVYYYLADPLWTVEALVDESADIVEAYAYRAYGEPTIKTADGGDGDWFDGDETTATSSAYSNAITFTGRQYDPETAFYYYRARIYDPLRGRFINRDPIEYWDGMNLYQAYFIPYSVDPLGLDTAGADYDGWWEVGGAWELLEKSDWTKCEDMAGKTWGNTKYKKGTKYKQTATIYLEVGKVQVFLGGADYLMPYQKLSWDEDDCCKETWGILIPMATVRLYHVKTSTAKRVNDGRVYLCPTAAENRGRSDAHTLEDEVWGQALGTCVSDGTNLALGGLELVDAIITTGSYSTGDHFDTKYGKIKPKGCIIDKENQHNAFRYPMANYVRPVTHRVPNERCEQAENAGTLDRWDISSNSFGSPLYSASRRPAPDQFPVFSALRPVMLPGCDILPGPLEPLTPDE